LSLIANGSTFQKESFPNCTESRASLWMAAFNSDLVNMINRFINAGRFTARFSSSFLGNVGPTSLVWTTSTDGGSTSASSPPRGFLAGTVPVTAWEDVARFAMAGLYEL
jgi:hypothetical protein